MIQQEIQNHGDQLDGDAVLLEGDVLFSYIIQQEIQNHGDQLDH